MKRPGGPNLYSYSRTLVPFILPTHALCVDFLHILYLQLSTHGSHTRARASAHGLLVLFPSFAYTLFTLRHPRYTRPPHTPPPTLLSILFYPKNAAQLHYPTITQMRRSIHSIHKPLSNAHFHSRTQDSAIKRQLSPSSSRVHPYGP